MSEEDKFNQIYPEYCCIDLVRAVQSEFLDEVVSGIFFPNKDESQCKEGIPRVKFCPFCGAEIFSIELESGWAWKTIKKED